MTASWFEKRLPTVLSNYELPDIYNADEFGLFFQALPSKSLHLKDEKCIGGKFSKVRLTGLAAANANGENCHCSLSANRSLQDASKTSNNCLAATEGRKKVGWTVISSSNGFANWIESSSSRIGRLC